MVRRWNDASMMLIFSSPTRRYHHSRISSASESLAQSGRRELVIIADDIDGEALTGIILNNSSESLVWYQGSWFWRQEKRNAQRSRNPHWCNPITEETGYKLDNATIDHLGHAKAVVATKDNTTIISGAGEKHLIDGRVKELWAQIDVSKSDFDKEKLAERIAKLAGGIAVIKVGAASEIEMKEKKLRIEDALNATKAAVDEGIVAGGG